MNIRNLLTRSLSGIIYVGLIVGCIFWGYIPFLCVVLLFITLATVEFNKLCWDKKQDPRVVAPLILDLAGTYCVAFFWLYVPMLFWIGIFILRLITELYLRNSNPIKCLAQSVLSQFYIGMPFACVLLIGATFHLHLILAVFLMIWINDTGAFLVGCTFGKHRLFERISPKKSWEGFYGGLFFNLVAATLFWVGGKGFWGVPEWNVITWLLFGATVTVFATWGDLIESMFKRSLNVKDSGTLIPGHGGILDRIDSILLAFPAVLIFLFLWASTLPEMNYAPFNPFRF